jgi:hypothetical protein
LGVRLGVMRLARINLPKSAHKGWPPNGKKI